MLPNAYFLAKIGADTAENERNFAEILQKFAKNWQLPYGRAKWKGPTLPANYVPPTAGSRAAS